MAVRKVIVMGHPTLRLVAKPVPQTKIRTPEFQRFLKDMTETMFEYDGRGLAAPQINESIQVVVMLWDFDEGKEPRLMYLINPEIKPLMEEQSSFWEGCLSVPGLRGLVSRPNKIQVNALNENGEKFEFVAEGFCATVVQHEVDHLLGKLYIDRIEDMKNLAFNREFAKFHAPEGTTPDEGDNE